MNNGAKAPVRPMGLRFKVAINKSQHKFMMKKSKEVSVETLKLLLVELRALTALTREKIKQASRTKPQVMRTTIPSRKVKRQPVRRVSRKFVEVLRPIP